MQKRLLQNLKLFLVLDSSQSESGNPECSSERNPIAGGGTFVQNDRGKMNSDRSREEAAVVLKSQDRDMRAQLAQKQASHAPPPWYQAIQASKQSPGPQLSVSFLCLSQSAQYKPCLPAPTQPRYDRGERAERTAESTKAHAKVCGLLTQTVFSGYL